MSRKKILLKIVIGGDASVGKTSIMNRFVRNIFNPRYKATVGADFVTKEIDIDGRAITVQLWDTAGQERFKSLGVAFYRGADAFICVYDVNRTETFESMDQQLAELTQHYDGKLDTFPLLVFGNKLDEKKAVIKREQASEWIQKRGGNTLFYEISCKDDSDKAVIDNALVELCRICVRNHADIKSIFEEDNDEIEEQNKHIRMPRQIDPVKKRSDAENTLCGGPNSNCLAMNRASTVNSCQIL